MGHPLKISDGQLARPYLVPVYDEPEFILHNIWRMYGGWYDGNPAHLKPAPASALALEFSRLAGGLEVCGLPPSSPSTQRHPIGRTG